MSFVFIPRIHRKHNISPEGLFKFGQALKFLNLKIIQLRIFNTSKTTDQEFSSIGQCLHSLTSLQEFFLEFKNQGRITDAGLVNFSDYLIARAISLKSFSLWLLNPNG